MNLIKTISLLLGMLLPILCEPAYNQLLMGSSHAEINFREGPGTDSKVLFTISKSNLLVILPAELQNGFAEVFDIESNSFGYVFESLIQITDTLNFQKQHFFERSGITDADNLDVELINQSDRSLFVWINKCIYHLDPHEKKDLFLTDEEIIYFSSAPGLYPVFGKEILKKGFIYKWNFSL
jgi:hypothetical protein